VSSHGRRRHRPAPVSTAQAGPAELGWALLVIAAAVIGGLAAATLVDASVVVAVIVSVVIGGIGVVALFRLPARSPGLRGGQGPPGPRREAPTAPGSRSARSASYPPDPVAPGGLGGVVPPGASGAPSASYPPDPVAPGAPSAAPPTAAGPAVRDGQGSGGPPASDETVVQLLPLPGAPDTPWWDSAQGPPSPSPGAQRAPAPDLSTYLAATFIAQCPRCGGFRLDIKRGRKAWDFRCESCENTWTWQPGTPWPPVRVVPP
jgi:hypothetical protein